MISFTDLMSSHRWKIPHGIKGALAALAAAALISGCAAPDVDVRRDAASLYSSAVESYLAGRLDESEKSLKSIAEDHPLSQYATDAQLLMGDVSFAMENYEDAASYYTSFVALHPSHPRASYAQFQKGMSHFKDVLSFDRDQTATRKALFAFDDLLAAYPDSPYSPRAKELVSFLKNRLAEREFYIANFYYKNRNYKGALGRLRDILAQYPEAGISDKTLFYIGESYLKLGERELAHETFSALISNYPASPFALEAKGKL
ncbi:MAG: outer membrane protein assembly factor BamD [Deltaproteobacteria bacterium]|nr:outer membrane protein assembly factor BamD [Deltaproteobacteria bacterium]